MSNRYLPIIACAIVMICETSCQGVSSPNHSTGGECYSIQSINDACGTQLSIIDASLMTVNSDGCVDITSIASHPCISNFK